MCDKKLLAELWATEKTSEQIAEILGMNKRNVLKEVAKLGLTGKKPRHSMATIRDALTYKQTHTMKETSEKFGVATSTIIIWSNKYNLQFGLKRKRKPNVNPRDRREIDWQPQVNVLKKVPEGLVIPTRGYGW